MPFRRLRASSRPGTPVQRETTPANYGANYERLAVKATYEPDNFFHINQNILPGELS